MHEISVLRKWEDLWTQQRVKEQFGSIRHCSVGEPDQGAPETLFVAERHQMFKRDRRSTQNEKLRAQKTDLS